MLVHQPDDFFAHGEEFRAPLLDLRGVDLSAGMLVQAKEKNVYDALVKVSGYQSMVITQVAQEVQHSAFPQAYADHEQEGRILASTLAGHSPGGIGCRLDAATASTCPEPGSVSPRSSGLTPRPGFLADRR